MGDDTRTGPELFLNVGAENQVYLGQKIQCEYSGRTQIYSKDILLTDFCQVSQSFLSYIIPRPLD